jgi:hypothetical protein
MAAEHPERPEEETGMSDRSLVTWHGEGETLWHIVDPTAADEEQPAVIKTFSSRSATRDDVRRFLTGSS